MCPNKPNKVKRWSFFLTFPFPFSQVGRPRYVSRRCGSCQASCRIFTSRALFWQPFTRSSTPAVQSPTAPSTSSTGPYWSDSMTGKKHMRVIFFNNLMCDTFVKEKMVKTLVFTQAKLMETQTFFSFCKQFSCYTLATTAFLQFVFCAQKYYL